MSAGWALARRVSGPNMGTSDNYLDLPPSERDRFVYRIVQVKHLLDLFDTNENVLVKPEQWDDPFENFILRSHFVWEDGEVASIMLRHYLYLQHWP